MASFSLGGPDGTWSSWFAVSVSLSVNFHNGHIWFSGGGQAGPGLGVAEAGVYKGTLVNVCGLQPEDRGKLVDDFLDGTSASVGGGFGLGGRVVASPSGQTAVEVGATTPNISVGGDFAVPAKYVFSWWVYNPDGTVTKYGLQ